MRAIHSRRVCSLTLTYTLIVFKRVSTTFTSQAAAGGHINRACLCTMVGRSTLGRLFEEEFDVLSRRRCVA